MSLPKTYAVMLKEVRHILRDRTTFIMLIFIPVFLMILFSYSLAADIKEVPITLMDNDRSALSREFVAKLSNSKDLVVGAEAENYAQAEDWFDRSLIKALVVIPPGFEQRILAGQPAAVQVLVDGTDPTTAEFAITHILSRAQMHGFDLALDISNRRVGNQLLTLIKTPIDLQVRTWFNPTLSNLTGIVPAMLALVLNIPVIAVLSAFVRERELGTLEGVFATPLGRSELLMGKTVPYIFFSLISALICLAAAIYIFNAPFAGNLIFFIILCADFFFAAFSMAIFVGLFLKSQAAAAVIGLLIFLFPAFFLSGVFFPVSAFPDIVRLEASFIPSTPFVAAMRGLMIKGQGLEALWPQVLMMFGVGVVMSLLSVLFFRKKIG